MTLQFFLFNINNTCIFFFELYSIFLYRRTLCFELVIARNRSFLRILKSYKRLQELGVVNQLLQETTRYFGVTSTEIKKKSWKRNISFGTKEEQNENIEKEVKRMIVPKYI